MANPLFDSFWRDERAYLWDAIEPLTMRALLAGAEGAAALLPGEIAPLVNWDFFNRAALRYLGEYRLTTVTGINATTQQQAIEAINEWVRSGQGLPSNCSNCSAFSASDCRCLRLYRPWVMGLPGFVPPCIRHRWLPLTGGFLHGVPLRVFAPHVA